LGKPSFVKTNGGFFIMKRHEVLRQIDIKETAGGKAQVFSVKFRTKKGECIFMPAAVSCGLRMDMAKNRMRGVQPVGKDLEPAGHHTPMSIDRIIEFNNKPVYL